MTDLQPLTIELRYKSKILSLKISMHMIFYNLTTQQNSIYYKTTVNIFCGVETLLHGCRKASPLS